MALISIIGASGVGKSFLVKQLASLNFMPGFFEGEQGTIPADILRNVFSGDDPTERYEYFVDRYRKNLERARMASNLGLDCYIDGAYISPEVTFLAEKDEYSAYEEKLTKIINKIKDIESDIMVLLTASESKIKEFMESRGRETEKNDKAIRRAVKIQNFFIERINHSKNGVIFDRNEFDFSKEKHLRIVDDLIKKNLKEVSNAAA